MKLKFFFWKVVSIGESDEIERGIEYRDYQRPS